MAVVLILISLSSSIAGLVILFLLAIRTDNVTDYLSITDWFGYFTKINQRPLSSWIVSCKLRKQYRDRPIREEIQGYGRIFRANFEILFDKLKPGVHYRVVTHYSALMEQAAADGRIRLLSPPVKLKRRTLRELKPLLGRQDFRLAKSCIMHCPHLKRCCEKCKRRSVCKCKRGGICPKRMDKAFVRYDFTIER